MWWSILKGILWFAKAVWKVLAAISTWVALHPIVGAIAGVAAAVAGSWLREQSWLGAQVAGGMLIYMGSGMIVTGLASWLIGPKVGSYLAGVARRSTTSRLVTFINPALGYYYLLFGGGAAEILVAGYAGYGEAAVLSGAAFAPY